MEASFKCLLLSVIFAFSSLHTLSVFAKSTVDESLKKVIDKKVLKVCSDAGFLPFEMKTRKGDWIGFDIDMMKDFAKSIHVELEMIQTSFDGIIPALKAGKCDFIVAGMTVTPERAKVVLFSEPTFVAGLSIGVKNNEMNKKLYTSLESLDKDGILFAVKSGYTSDLYLKKVLKKAKVVSYDSDAAIVMSVHQGRTQAFVSDTTFVSLMNKEYQKNSGKDDPFIIIPTDVTSEKFAIASKDSAVALMNAFNLFLSEWKNSGKYAKAEKYYFEDQLWRNEVNSDKAKN